jgi:hypothetical protein
MKKLNVVLIGIIISTLTIAQDKESVYLKGTINADPDFLKKF